MVQGYLLGRPGPDLAVALGMGEPASTGPVRG
jgi:hypothetical protein